MSSSKVRDKSRSTHIPTAKQEPVRLTGASLGDKGQRSDAIVQQLNDDRIADTRRASPLHSGWNARHPRLSTKPCEGQSGDILADLNGKRTSGKQLELNVWLLISSFCHNDFNDHSITPAAAHIVAAGGLKRSLCGHTHTHTRLTAVQPNHVTSCLPHNIQSASISFPSPGRPEHDITVQVPLFRLLLQHTPLRGKCDLNQLFITHFSFTLTVYDSS